MNGYFHLHVRVIGDTASTLVGEIILIWRPFVSIAIRLIELALRKHHQITMKLAAEWDVDIARLILGWYVSCVVGESTDDFRLSVTEGVVWLGSCWYHLKGRVRDSGISWVRRAILTRENDASHIRGGAQYNTNE